MTNAEKQEIIEAVLAALATNSKTIAQLSPKQSLLDSDLFEVAGGSRVTYQLLRSLIREGLALESQLSNYVTGDAAMMYLAKLDTETGTVDYKESPLVMLDGFKGVNSYTPVTGDLYYENWNGYQIWIKTQGGTTGAHANTHVAYVNKNDGAIYRWTGSSMVRIGGSAVINDLTTGGEGDALSAEMGLRLKNAIIQLWAAIGNYAFPGGRPMLDFSGGSQTEVAEVSTIFGQRVTPYAGESDVSIGDQLTVQLSTSDDLYVIDPSTVKVMMGGTDVTSSCYNENTDVVNIPTVIDDVEITANAMTYVGYGEQNSPLVFNLDGKNRGIVAGHWTDLAGNVDFVLTNCTENSDNVQFNGNSKGVSNGTLNVLYSAGSIESIFDVSDSEFPTYPKVQHILTNNISNGISMGLGFAPALNNSPCYCCVNSVVGVDYGTEVTGIPGLNDTIKAKQHIYYEKNSCYRNGQTQLTITENTVRFACDNTSPLAIGYRGRNLNGTPNEQFLVGKIFCIRVYSRTLTPNERMQNYKVDKKRFNLA